MHLRPIEAYTGLSSSTEPIYKDENITVYGIPISPSLAPECDEPPSPSDRPLKRRRLDPDSGSIPTSTSGSLAQEWRESIVKIMFPADRKHEDLREEKKEAKKKGKEKNKEKVDIGESAPAEAPSEAGNWGQL